MNLTKQLTGKKRSGLEWILLGIVSVQILVIILMNFVRAKYIMDYDSICALTQAAEIWKQKTLFITDWTYQTTLGWDSAVPAAALFYGITKNIFTAYGITNCLIVGLYLYVFHRICKDLSMSRVGEYVIYIIVFGPYTWDQLGYAKMMFTAAGYYSIKSIMSVMAVSILIRYQKSKKNQILFCMLFELFLFASSISTTVYELICCVAPVLLYQVIEIAYENKLFRDGRWHGKCLLQKQYLFSLISVLVAGAGVLLCKVLSLPINPPAMKLTTTANLPHNIAASITAVFALFGGSSSGEIEAVSLSGIYTLACFVLVVFVLASFLYCVVRMLYQKRWERMTGLVLCFVIVNMAILILADLTYGGGLFENRYHLLPMMAVILCSGITADGIKNMKNDTAKILAAILFAGIILYINGVGYQAYYTTDNSADELISILDDVEKNNIDILYVVGNENVIESRIMKSFAKQVQIITTADGQEAAENGSTTRYFDAGAVEHMHAAVLTTPEGKEDIPEKYLSKSTRIKQYEYRGYELYDLERNFFDFKSGLPEKNQNVSIDYPYSEGYVTPEKWINSEGALELDGTQETGIVMSGPYTDVVEGTYDITFDYEITENTGTDLPVFDVVLEDGSVSCGSALAEKEKKSVTISDVTLEKGKNIQFRLFAPQGLKMKYYKTAIRRVK